MEAFPSAKYCKIFLIYIHVNPGRCPQSKNTSSMWRGVFKYKEKKNLATLYDNGKHACPLVSHQKHM
jgi:hypothetical protein